MTSYENFYSFNFLLNSTFGVVKSIFRSLPTSKEYLLEQAGDFRYVRLSVRLSGGDRLGSMRYPCISIIFMYAKI